MVDALDKLSDPTTTIFISYEHRHFPDYNPKDRFCELLEGKGMKISRIVPEEELDQDYFAHDIVVWEIHRKMKAKSSMK